MCLYLCLCVCVHVYMFYVCMHVHVHACLHLGMDIMQEEHGYDSARGTWLDMRDGQLVDTPKVLLEKLALADCAVAEVPLRLLPYGLVAVLPPLCSPPSRLLGRFWGLCGSDRMGGFFSFARACLVCCCMRQVQLACAK